MKNSCNILKYSLLATVLGLSAFSAKGVDDTQLELACEMLDKYDVDAARDHVDRYLKQGGRRAKPTAAMTAAADSVTELIDRVEIMLGRVEHIEVVDSMVVDRGDFYRYYGLGLGAGSLFDTKSLPEELHAGGNGVGYKSPDGRLIIWSQPGQEGVMHLVESSALTDGSWEKPTPLPGNFSQGGDVLYPYMLTDGATLYFATDGPESLGGLDIMLTRYDGEQWLEPQNVGFPYNSPYDDYMMAIDETSGAGWWATDRNNLGDKITIYMFRPNEIRENYPEDTPDIASRAMLTSIRDTWRDPRKVDSFLAKFKTKNRRRKSSADVEHDFVLSMGNGRVYYSLDDFKSPQAREAMEDYLIMEDELRIDKIDLDNLRQQYAQGDPSCHDDILLLEAKICDRQKSLPKLRNRIIAIETHKYQ